MQDRYGVGDMGKADGVGVVMMRVVWVWWAVAW